MQLARHLVDRGVIRYQAGEWSLPESLAADDLPSNMLQALRSRVSVLGATAAELAHVRALAPDLRCSLDECVQLAAASTREVLAALAELVAAELVVAVRGDHLLAGAAILVHRAKSVQGCEPSLSTTRCLRSGRGDIRARRACVSCR
jgi:hypothetical protein